LVRLIFKSLRRLVPFTARVEYFRARRSLSDRKSGIRLAHKLPENLRGAFTHTIFSHRARLIREYPEPWYSLQKNKIVNLTLASAKIDGTVVRQGEVFSFWHCVGRTSEKAGYLPGMTIADGKLSGSVGGGLCQLSNALYWAALHAGGTIIERHRHSFDCFPDSHRTVPFGAGATVFYNYVDFRFRNNGESGILIHTFLDDEYLHVEIRADRPWDKTYRVIEENHRYFTRQNIPYRGNSLTRIVSLNGKETAREHIAHNEGKLLYDVSAKTTKSDTEDSRHG